MLLLDIVEMIHFCSDETLYKHWPKFIFGKLGNMMESCQSGKVGTLECMEDPL